MTDSDQAPSGAETTWTVDGRGVGRLTIAREAQRNALNEGVLTSLTRVFREAPEDPRVRAIVLTGAGDRAFCAGADLKGARDAFAVDFARPKSAYAEMLRAGYACTLPIVGRIDGVCLAGGMGLLAICDLAIASDRAVFGLPEVKIGLFPMQVLSVLERLMPPRLFAELAFTGEPLAATDARAAGLVNDVVPPAELDARVERLVARLVDASPAAQRRGKAALRAIAGLPFERALPYLETQIATLALTDDAREGRSAFLERRRPNWKLS